MARPTVTEYIERATAVGLSWPLPAELEETSLERLLFPPRSVQPTTPRAMPNWPTVHEELQRKGVTLFLLWHEYKAHASHRLWLHLVLYAVPGLGAETRSGHAP